MQQAQTPAASEQSCVHTSANPIDPGNQSGALINCFVELINITYRFVVSGAKGKAFMSIQTISFLNRYTTSRGPCLCLFS